MNTTQSKPGPRPPKRVRRKPTPRTSGVQLKPYDQADSEQPARAGERPSAPARPAADADATIAAAPEDIGLPAPEPQIEPQPEDSAPVRRPNNSRRRSAPAAGEDAHAATPRHRRVGARRTKPDRTGVVGGVSVRHLSDASRRAGTAAEDAPRPTGPYPDPTPATSLPSAEGPAARRTSRPEAQPAPHGSASRDDELSLPPFARADMAGPAADTAAPAGDEATAAPSARRAPIPAAVPSLDALDPFEQPYDDYPEHDAPYDYGQFQRVEQGFASADPMARKSQKKRRTKRNVLIAALVLLVLGAGGWWVWTHRGVEVTVNGSRVSAAQDATVAEVFDAERWNIAPGNLVSVAGNVITERGGEPYVVTVDGTEYTADQAAGVVLRGGEEIEFAHGPDVTEEYESEYTPIAPKLLMTGNEGSVAFISQWGYEGADEVRVGKLSGETAPGDGTPVQDCVIEVLDPTPADGQKLIALTFDDGPSYYTQQILKVLQEKGAKATFFNIGQYVEINPEISREIVQAGSQLCSHTMSHAQLTASSSEKVLQEVVDAFAAIKAATGQDTSTFRPPYGSFWQTTWLETQGHVSASVLWDIDTEDWAKPTADQIYQEVMKNAHPGAIVLMHDGGGDRTADVVALPSIIEGLQDAGYRLVTLSELLASDERIPSEIAAGDATMPADAVWPTEIG